MEEKYRGGRVEILSFISSPEVRSKGKGFGEQDIIRQAVMSSSHLKDADYIIKITGKIKVLSINYLINLIIKKSAKKKKWVIAEKLFNGHWIHSYCFAAHKDFLTQNSSMKCKNFLK